MNLLRSIFVPLLGLSFLLNGCVSKKKSDSPPAPPSPPPPRIILNDIPSYSSPNKQYNTSATCVLLPLKERDDSLKQLFLLLRSELKETGYSLLSFGTFPVAEERASYSKLLELKNYARRSTTLSDGKEVVDMVVFVRVLQRPGKLNEIPKNIREFYAWGRGQADTAKEAESQAASLAIKHLFTLDPFRKSLEP